MHSRLEGKELKKQTAVFLAAAIALSIALQAVFASFFFRISDFRLFSFFRAKIEKAARLSCGTEDSYMGLASGGGLALLAIPSCSPDLTLVAGSVDCASLLCQDNTAVFSLYPSASSARKHTSFYVRNIGYLDFTCAGGLFEFKCRIKNKMYGRSFFIMRSPLLLPAGITVF
jgi:hypothetical protein